MKHQPRTRWTRDSCVRNALRGPPAGAAEPAASLSPCSRPAFEACSQLHRVPSVRSHDSHRARGTTRMETSRVAARSGGAKRRASPDVRLLRVADPREPLTGTAGSARIPSSASPVVWGVRRWIGPGRRASVRSRRPRRRSIRQGPHSAWGRTRLWISQPASWPGTSGIDASPSNADTSPSRRKCVESAEERGGVLTTGVTAYDRGLM